ncbi:hypothetical protein QTP70_009701 [Hemibagrus guttatus]|uniref:ODAD1 central coiled coil region domain-containing protein n=1 Tax=Hemibagrus guttatus TaxID=175788 RepID=A0AAE0Q3X5_9TELE|nr:hypothetical protein QTP70_009701 [Hemibagrus guttatus]
METYFSSEKMRSPIHDQISTLQRKIQVLEGETSMQYETSKCLIQKNRERVLQLRQENKLLHRKLAKALAADEQVIRDAFQSHRSEEAAYRKMSGKDAVQALDQKVCVKVKKLNALKHMTNTQRHRLEELNTEYNTVRATSPGLLTDVVTTYEVDLRVLESQLEKAQLKCQETEHIIRSYHKLKEHLQEESLTFQSRFDELDCEIKQKKQELRYMQLMFNNAHQASQEAKAELQRQKSMMCSERREQELVLNRYKKHAEEQKAQTDRGKRRAQRVAPHTGKLSSEAQCSGTAERENKKTISSFKEAFSRITEATGVTDTQELVDRFVSQRDSHTHMQKMKLQNERELQRLKEERDAVHTQYQDLKYSGDAKLTNRRKVVEECVSQLQREQQKQDAAKETVEKLTHTLKTVRTSVTYLCYKLKYIKLQDAPVQRECESPLDVLDLLQEAELKLMQLQDELQGHDIHRVMKEMKQQKLDCQRADLHEEEDDSEDDDDDSEVFTRISLKQQSQLTVDSRKNKLP